MQCTRNFLHSEEKKGKFILKMSTLLRSFWKGLSLTQYYSYYYMKLFKSPTTSSTLNHASCSHKHALKLSSVKTHFICFKTGTNPNGNLAVHTRLVDANVSEWLFKVSSAEHNVCLMVERAKVKLMVFFSAWKLNAWAEI